MSVEQLAEFVLSRCRSIGLKLATAESCTGGLIAGVLTEIAGSSDVFERGFITYSNQAKCEMLGIPIELLEKYGAVSEEMAVSMAERAVAISRANLAVSVTGIVGPGGGNQIKPVGLVYMAIAWSGHKTLHFRDVFEGDRIAVRSATVYSALKRISSAISEEEKSPSDPV